MPPETRPEPRQPNRRIRPLMAAMLAAALPLGLTVPALQATRESAEHTWRARFVRETDDATVAIRERLSSYVELTHAAAALFASSDVVTGAEWRTFTEHLMADRFPAVAAFAYAPLLSPGALPGFEAAMQAEGLRSFRVHPASTLPISIPIQYLDPADTRQSLALGFDLASEPSYRAAAELSRDQGEVVMTAGLTPGSDARQGPAVLMLHSIYRRGAPTNTQEDRRAAIQGWVCAGAHIDVLIGRLHPGFSDLDLQVVDGNHWLYGAPGNRASALPVRDASLTVGHRTWMLRFTGKPEFGSSSTGREPIMVAALGGLASLVGFVFTWSLVRSHGRALSLAARSSQTLLYAEERSSALIANLLEGLIVVDHSSVIESVNPAAARIFGYEPAEMAGMALRRLLPPQADKDPEAFRREARKKALGKVTQWEGRRQDGTVFPFELSMFEFDGPQGRRFGGLVRDLAERNRLERLKHDFVATVSHELRTPLTSIRGSLSLLASGALGALPEDASELIAIAERNTVRLVGLINDILDLERLAAGRLDIQPAVTPAEPLLERAIDAVRGIAAPRRIALRVRAGASVSIHADADRILQVLINLLSNAVKFSPDGTTITLAVDHTPLGMEFRVEDQGRGVPRHLRDAIFERFQQVEMSDAREKGGTGLGLAICKAIVERHGGSIGVDDAPGGGSRFWFRLPVPAGTDPIVQALRDGLGRGSAADVLVVDDDEAVLGLLGRQLLQAGLSVRTAASAADATALARNTPPHLLVLDIQLAEGSGYDVVRVLRADPAVRNTPLLVYTVQDLNEEERRRLRLGPTRFLTKSRVTNEEFMDAVFAMLPASAQVAHLERRAS